ncbi:g6f-like isoform X1 [Toxotes jaculatrix]|uniref:g6f-like isoform X1 n=1 Tax=Toxotes jaculatrix TaxID=941984 RepID=UPI001B3AFC88|nr:g6f-like isoform X1 [Toxotes jaculatrix]
MDSGFLTFILVSSFAAYPSHLTGWDNVVVAREGMSTTLVCTDTTVRGAVAINWMVKSHDKNDWKLVLSASEGKEFSGGASKASMRLTDPNFQDTGVFSLSFAPNKEDSGLYSCLIKQQEKQLKTRIILLAVLTVTVLPAPTMPQHSTLRLIASVNPDFVKINWVAPDGISMKSEKITKDTTVAKLPQVQTSDNGTYVCTVHPYDNSSSILCPFRVNVIVHVDKVASFTNITHDPMIATATLAQTSFTLTCPGVQGDYVMLYWGSPDNKKHVKLVHQYDRWRGSTLVTTQSKKLQLAGRPYNAEAGSFSFLLTPGIKDGGLYICEVFLNDNAYSQRTLLSVLKVKTNHSPSKLELSCQYSERSHVQSAIWKYQNKSRRLRMSSSSPGTITITVPLPITSDTAGNYTCTLKLKNGQTIWATQAVTLPPEDGRDESVSVTATSLLPSLSALLLLVPLVAAAVGVLLWRQKHISDRGIEQSLSIQSSEAENIYENPEDIRQTPPQGSVYMDLKPRGEDDVYKELERSEQCQS